MFKPLLLFATAVLLTLSASAQFRYSFKDTTTAYAPLTSATSVNGATIWDDNDYTVPTPFTWTLDSSIALNNVFLALGMPGFIADTTDFSDVNGFFLGGGDIADRGNVAKTASLSPVRYTTTGSTPNRIFKLEFSNLGFYGELDSLGTMNDSANMQLWIYETSNILELHFGPSRITDPFIDFDGGLLFSFLSHADFFTGSQGEFYYVTDSLGVRGIDSFSITGGPTSNNFPTAWPADGTVFRFTPRWKPCPLPVIPTFTAATPTGNSVVFTYTGSTTGIDSLVWFFGDGKTQKVTTAFTTPITHAYDSAGHYGAFVRAYNSCGIAGSTTIQTAVSVKGIGGLKNVQIYPNPATDKLFIEGVEPGSTATVLAVDGRVVIRTELNASKAELNVSVLPSGSYTILLSQKDGRNGAMHFVKQ